MSTRVLATAGGRWLALEDGVVVEEGLDAVPPDAQQLGDVLLEPGFVDLQVNGIGDVDFWAADPDAWRRAGERLLSTGLTSYLPTLATAPLDEYDAGLARVAAAQADAIERGLPRVEGVHLEGPFLGDAPGAHPVHLIRPMDVDWLLALLDAHPGLVRLVTLAPEADPDFAGIRALVARGVVVALGHSRCSYDDAIAAAEAGARLVTHLFNGMGPLDHREPGLPGAALSEPRLTPTLIADFVHVHPAVLRLALRLRSCALVTDAVATGVDYFGQRVIERDGAAFLEDGTLTGSTLTMDRAVRNAVSVGLEHDLAVQAATALPAAELDLGVWARKGIGHRADLVALDRGTLEVVGVWLSGERAYARP